MVLVESRAAKAAVCVNCLEAGWLAGWPDDSSTCLSCNASSDVPANSTPHQSDASKNPSSKMQHANMPTYICTCTLHYTHYLGTYLGRYLDRYSTFHTWEREPRCGWTFRAVTSRPHDSGRLRQPRVSVLIGSFSHC